MSQFTVVLDSNESRNGSFHSHLQEVPAHPFPHDAEANEADRSRQRTRGRRHGKERDTLESDSEHRAPYDNSCTLPHWHHFEVARLDLHDTRNISVSIKLCRKRTHSVRR